MYTKELLDFLDRQKASKRLRRFLRRFDAHCLTRKGKTVGMEELHAAAWHWFGTSSCSSDKMPWGRFGPVATEELRQMFTAARMHPTLVGKALPGKCMSIGRALLWSRARERALKRVDWPIGVCIILSGEVLMLRDAEDSMYNWNPKIEDITTSDWVIVDIPFIR